MVELALEVEPDSDGAAARSLEHRIAFALRDSLSLRIPVTAVPRGTLPRFEMKAKRWVVEQAAES
jgi:phenylacetate-CoA ligase